MLKLRTSIDLFLDISYCHHHARNRIHSTYDGPVSMLQKGLMLNVHDCRQKILEKVKITKMLIVFFLV